MNDLPQKVPVILKQLICPLLRLAIVRPQKRKTMKRKLVLFVLLLINAVLANKERDLFLSGGSNGLGAQYRVLIGRFAFHTGLQIGGDYYYKRNDAFAIDNFSLNANPYIGIGFIIRKSNESASLAFLECPQFAILSYEYAKYKADSSLNLNENGLNYNISAEYLRITYEQFWLKGSKTHFGAGFGSGLYSFRQNDFRLKILAYLLLPLKSWNPGI